jgi:hypothetical protein
LGAGPDRHAAGGHRHDRGAADRLQRADLLAALPRAGGRGDGGHRRLDRPVRRHGAAVAGAAGLDFTVAAALPPGTSGPGRPRVPIPVPLFEDRPP